MRARIAALVVAAALVGGCHAEERPVKESEVPKPVLDARAKAYPTAKTIAWEQEGDEYEVKLDDSGRRVEVEFREDGSIKEIEEPITLETAPESVKKTIAGSRFAKMAFLFGEVKTKSKKSGEREPPHFKLVFKDGDKAWAVKLDEKGAITKEHEVSSEKLAKWQAEHAEKK